MQEQDPALFCTLHTVLGPQGEGSQGFTNVVIGGWSALRTNVYKLYYINIKYIYATKHRDDITYLKEYTKNYYCFLLN